MILIPDVAIQRMDSLSDMGDPEFDDYYADYDCLQIGDTLQTSKWKLKSSLFAFE